MERFNVEKFHLKVLSVERVNDKLSYDVCRMTDSNVTLAVFITIKSSCVVK